MKADFAEQIKDRFAKSFAEKEERDRKEKEDAEAAALHGRLVQNHLGDLLYKREARKLDRQMRGKPARKLSWERNGADFARAVVRRAGHYLAENYGAKRHEWPAGEVISIKAQMAESSGTTGGYVVPQAMASTILAPFRQRSIFRSRGALQLATRTRGLFLPTPDVTSAQAAGVPPWAGGLNFSWTSEGHLRTESEPKFKQIELVKNELTGDLVISRDLFDDGSSVALQAVLRDLIGQAVAWIEEYAFFQGTGAGQPQGIVNSAASISVTRQTGGSITYQDVSSLLSKLPPSSLGNAVFAFNPTAQTKLMQLADGSNRAVFLAAGAVPAGQRPQWTLCGLPAVPTDALPALGTKGDLVLIDPSFYGILDNGDAAGGSLEIIASDQVTFLTNQVTLRVVRRTDGQPLIDQPITLGDGSSQVSPFVVLH